MIGKITKIGTSMRGDEYAFIKAGKDKYYFDDRSTDGVPMSDFFVGDYVEFDPCVSQRGLNANDVRLMEIQEGKLARFFNLAGYGYINSKISVQRNDIINYSEFTVDTDRYEYLVSFWVIPDTRKPNGQRAVGVKLLEQLEKVKLNDLIVPPLDEAVAEKVGAYLAKKFPNKKVIALSVLRDVLNEIGESPELHGFENMTLFCKALPSVMSLQEFEEGQRKQIYAVLHRTNDSTTASTLEEEKTLDTEDDGSTDPAGENSDAQPECINKYYNKGFGKFFNKERAYEKSLKPQSGEAEIIDKLSEIFRIFRVNYHERYQYCIAGATEIFKQYIPGQHEFLIVFSHFDTGDWRSETLQAEKEIRKRKDVADRFPLVNFYLLISNARTLRAEVDALKGGSTSAIIPFSFEELLSCSSSEELAKLVLSRFGDYYFENNMLGETSAIDDDSLLFGDRGKIADAIAYRCQSVSYSGIFGLRRSGKTSVLQAVFRRLKRKNIKYVKIESSELETLDSWKTALFDIARKIREATLDVRQGPEETRQAYFKRLNLNSTEEDYSKRASQYFGEDVRLYCRNEDIVVIAIDEIESITYNTAKADAWKSIEAYCGFWSALRDCGCPLIVCGVNATISEVNSISYNGKTGDNPMYGRIQNCTGSSSTYLPPFTDAQTKYMINTLGSYSGIAFSNVYQAINHAFGGQPFAIRQFCSYVYENVKEHRVTGVTYEVSTPAVVHLLDQFSKSREGYSLCEVILQHIRIYQDEYITLCNIATAPEKYQKMTPEQVRCVDHLVKYGLIEWDKSTNYLSFRIQIIQNYISENVPKDPRLMSNDERRRYVQDNVAMCERNLKTYLRNYYLYNAGSEQRCRNYFSKYIADNKYKDKKGNEYNKVTKTSPPLDPQTCDISDFFDHKKLVLYFSKISSIIKSDWSNVGSGISSLGISMEAFVSAMNDLNAGRTDADHYDAEDLSVYPDKWDIDDQTMQAFTVALAKLQPIFDKYNS